MSSSQLKHKLFRLRPTFFVDEYACTFRYAEQITFFSDMQVSTEMFMVEFDFDDLPLGPSNFGHVLEILRSQLQQFGRMVITSNHLIWNNGKRVQIYVNLEERIRFSSDPQILVAPVHREKKKLSSSRRRAVRYRDNVNKARSEALAKQEVLNSDSVQFKSAPASGSLKVSTFNGNKLLEPILFMSTGTSTECEESQVESVVSGTDSDQESETQSQCLEIQQQIMIGRSRNYNNAENKLEMVEYKYPHKPFESDRFYLLNRLAVNEIFDRARKILAFFGSHKNICYNGDTYISLMAALHNDGVKVSVEDLETLYYEFFELRDVKKEDVESDLRMFSENITTHRLLHLAAASEAATTYYGGQHRSINTPQRGPCVLM